MLNRKNIFIILIISLIFSIFGCKVGDFDETVDYTITYYYNREDGSVATSSFTNHVRKGVYLEQGPTSWSDGKWTAKDNIGFGYIGDGKIGKKNVEYRYSIEDKIWYFYQLENIEWDSSQPINTSLSLKPLYREVEATEFVNVTIEYMAPLESSLLGYEVKSESKHFRASDVKTGTIYLSDLVDDCGVFSLNKADVIGYGYTDKSDHGHKYCFEEEDMPSVGEDSKPIYTFSLYDADGNYYDDFTTNTVISEEFDGKIIRPKYVSAGYEEINASDTDAGAIDFIKQVFIPGNKNSDGSLNPFPYSAAGSSPIVLNSNRQISANSDPYIIYSDEIERNLEIPNMYMMQTPVLSSLYNKIKTSTDSRIKPLLNNGTSSLYTFYSVFNNAAKTAEILNTLSYCDSLILANLLTEYYNILHPNDKLSFVYHVVSVQEAAKTYNADGTVSSIINYNYSYPSNYRLTDSTVFRGGVAIVSNNHKGDGTSASYTSNAAKCYIVIDDNATGFRLPYDYIWEYAARIITDERQIPNDDVMTVISQIDYDPYDVIIKPTAENEFKNYFQSAKGAYNSATVSNAYLGSGAGLATWNGKKYDKKSLRPYTLAVGKSANSYKDDSDIPLASSGRSWLTQDANGKEDENRKNGAGLYGMNSCVWQYCSTFASSITDGGSNNYNHVVLRGGARNFSSSDSPHSCALGYTLGHPFLNAGLPRYCARFLRYVFD